MVVRLEEVEKGKAFPEFQSPRVQAMDCRFMPFVNVVRDQHEIMVVNMDPAMHDIQAYETSHLGPRPFQYPAPVSVLSIPMRHPSVCIFTSTMKGYR